MPQVDKMDLESEGIQFDLLFLGPQDKNSEHYHKIIDLLTEKYGFEVSEIEGLLSESPVSIKTSSNREELVSIGDALRSVGANVLIVRRREELKDKEPVSSGSPENNTFDLESFDPLVGLKPILAETYGVQFACFGDDELRAWDTEECQSIFEEGVRNLKGNALEQAISCFSENLRIHNSFPEALLNIGNAYFLKHEFSQAKEFYYQALDIDEYFFPAQLSLGVILIYEKDYEAAFSRFERILEINPVALPAFVGKGNALAMGGRIEEAADSFREALKLDPSNYEAGRQLRSLTNPEEAKQDGDQRDIAIENLNVTGTTENTDPNQRAFDLFTEANRLMDRSKFKEAIELFEEALALAPDRAEIWSNMGNAYFSMSEWEKAVEFFQKAVRLSPDLKAAHCNLGNCYINLKHWKEAVSSYKKAFALDHGDLRVILNLGKSLKELGEIDDAIVIFQKGVEDNPACGDFHLQLGELYAKKGLRAESENHYRKAKDLGSRFHGPDPVIQEDPGRVSNAYNEEAAELISKARKFAEQKRYDQAINCFKEALIFIKDSPELLVAIGNIYSFLSDWEQAISYYEQASNLDPNREEIYFNLAAAYAQAGMYQEAELAYKLCLAEAPDHKEALYRQGLNLIKLNSFNEAIAAFHKVIALDENHAGGYLYLGRLYAEKGRTREAEFYSERAEELGGEEPELSGPLELPFKILSKADRQSAEEHIQKAHRLMGEKEFQLATEEYLKALKYAPERHDLLLSAGNAYFSQKDWGKAIELYEKAVKIQKDFQPAYYNLGNSYCAIEEWTKGLEAFQMVEKLEPGHIVAMISQARILLRFDRTDEAIIVLERAVASDSDCAEALVRLGITYHQMNQVDQAEKYFRRVTAIQSDDPQKYCDIANAYLERDQPQTAIVYFKHALGVKEDHVPALLGISGAFGKLDQTNESIRYLEKAVEIDPHNTGALNNLGNQYFSVRRTEEGIACFNKAVNMNAQDVLSNYNRAFTLLLQGDYKRGWEEFEWRLRKGGASRRPYKKPYWDGSSLEGKSIFVYLEQGFGDCIHCARYVTQLAEQGAKVYLEYRIILQRLFESMDNITAVSEHDPLPEFDCYVSIMSLPHLMGTTMENLPKEVPYFKVPELRTHRLKLAKTSKPKIGFVWKGNVRQGNNRHRSFYLKDFKEILEIPDIKLFSLQKPILPEEQEFLDKMEHITVLENDLTDFGDTASVMDQLDLVLTIDTSVAHLTGALAKPGWVMLCHNSSWQWLLDREDSPWYPTLRMFRQGEPGDWREMFQRIALALKEEFGIERLPEEYSEDEQMLLAEKYLEAGYLTGAEKILTKFESDQPEYNTALCMLSEIAESREEFDEAVSLLTKVIALDPLNVDYHERLGRVYFRQGNFESASAAFKSILEINPSHTRAMANLGNCLMAMEEVEQAEEQLSRIIELDAGLLEGHLLQGDIFSQKGQWNEAVESYRRVVDGDPYCLKARLKLSGALLEEGSSDQAVAACQAVLDLDPHYIKGYLALGDIYFGLDQFDEAILNFEKALESDPDLVEAHYRIARALRASGRTSDAIKRYYLGLQRDPFNISIHNELGDVMLADDKADEAIISYGQALRIKEDSLPTCLHLVNAFFQVHDLSRAVSYLEKAERLCPDDLKIDCTSLRECLEEPEQGIDWETQYETVLEQACRL